MKKTPGSARLKAVSMNISNVKSGMPAMHLTTMRKPLRKKNNPGSLPAAD
jgi:hypothetical protein